MPRLIIVFPYLLMLLALGAALLVVTRPDWALTSVLYHGRGAWLGITAAVSGFIYLAAGLPLVVRRNRRGLIEAGVLLALVGLGPWALGQGAMASHEARVPTVAATAPSVPIRVMDMRGEHDWNYDDCWGPCAEILGLGEVEIVRMTDPEGEVKGSWRAGPDGPVRVEAPVADAQATIRLTRPRAHDFKPAMPVWGFGMARLDYTTVVEITEGPAAMADAAQALYRGGWPSYNRPLLPALYSAPTHGWVSGGNDGGVVLLRAKRPPSREMKAEIMAAYKALGIARGDQ